METLEMPKPASRRKVHKDEKALPPEPRAIGIGDNGPDDETVLLYAGKIKAEMVKMDLQRKRLTAAKRMAKNAGIYVTELVEAIANQELDPETVEKTFARREFYNRVLNTPVGTQMSLFDRRPKSSIPTPEERAESGYRRGYMDGVMGHTADEQAYPPGHPNYSDYVQGWTSGQKVHLDRIKPLDDALDQAMAPKAKPKAGDAGKAE